MKKLAVAAVLLPFAVWAGDKFKPLDVKTGLWESTTTTTSVGQIPLPEDLLSKLSPEQRARYEARVKANSGEKTRTFTNKSCLTKEKLDRGTIFDNKECTQTVLDSSASKLQLRVACQGEGMKTEGSLIIETLGSESVKGSGTMAMVSGGHTMNSKTSMTAKWLGSSCGDVK